MSFVSGIVSRFLPHQFYYPERKLTMEEMLNKIISEGKRELEEMEIFINKFRTINELLLKEQNNSLSELKIRVHELSKLMNNVWVLREDIKGVTTRGGKVTSTVKYNVEANKGSFNKGEPPRSQPLGQNKTKVVVNKDPLTVLEQTIRPPTKPQQQPISFPNQLRKEKDEAQQRKFLENLKQLHINIPFIKALVQMPKYTKYLKSLLTNKSRLEEACTVTINERQSIRFLFTEGFGESVDQTDLVDCNDVTKGFASSSDINKSKHHIDSINTAYSNEQKPQRIDQIGCELLYSASANEIDEKKPKLKDLPPHLEYAYLQGNESFPIIISSKLSEK
nr:hypothetical protein [Tanacetum cinerariifolium]